MSKSLSLSLIHIVNLLFIFMFTNRFDGFNEGNMVKLHIFLLVMIITNY